MLLRAFARVAAAVPNAELLLAGDGALRESLRAQANALAIGSRVRFLGVRDDVPDLLRASDIFALTSISEAASLTLLQAMACRLPVVVTAVGGNPEIVQHGERWSEGLVPRVCFLSNQEYLVKDDAQRFTADYQFLASQMRTPPNN